jgi:hypothetical protein
MSFASSFFLSFFSSAVLFNDFCSLRGGETPVDVDAI